MLIDIGVINNDRLKFVTIGIHYVKLLAKFLINNLEN